ncbi:MAG: sigma-70 family RNA polymerase sigma factor [Armatimonadetes bacterium]|nr:sigma-70 family RNA polymerase sigma factor [Armatimonadota bacterium]
MASSPRQHEPQSELSQFSSQLEDCIQSIRRILRKKVRERYVQEEILSETLLTAWKKYQHGERVENFRGWLRQILALKILECFRREQTKGEGGKEREAFNEEQHSGAGAGVYLDAKIDWERITEVLTKEEAVILWRHYGNGESWVEIAEELGKKEQTVRKQGNRAKQKVQSHFPELDGLY